MPESNSQTPTPGGTARLGEQHRGAHRFRGHAARTPRPQPGGCPGDLDRGRRRRDRPLRHRCVLRGLQRADQGGTRRPAGRRRARHQGRRRAQRSRRSRARAKARGAQAPSRGQPRLARDRPPRRGEPAPPGSRSRHPRRGRPGGRYRPAAGRARSAARRGHDRRHRAIQRVGAAARACPARRHRLRPEPVQPARARHRSRARGLSPERCRMGAVLPAGVRLPRPRRRSPTIQPCRPSPPSSERPPRRSVSRGCLPNTRTRC